MPEMQPITILLAEDDPDDRLLANEAIEKNDFAHNLKFVKDGEELLNYLYHRQPYNKHNAPKPGLILISINMPKIDGREALKIIKSDALLKRIPVIILTTSKAEEDILRSYDLGVNSFITKPVTFDDLIKITKEIGKYWFGIVRLPNQSYH